TAANAAGSDERPRRLIVLFTRTQAAGRIWTVPNARESLSSPRNLPLRCSRVLRKGTDEGVVFGLLDHVGGPAGDAAHHEDGREHGDVETHQVIGGPGREVEVRVDVFLTHHDVL